jgi:hypothetical protein
VEAGSNHDSNLNPFPGVADNDTPTPTGHSLEKVAERQAAPACGQGSGLMVLDEESSSALHG